MDRFLPKFSPLRLLRGVATSLAASVGFAGSALADECSDAIAALRKVNAYVDYFDDAREEGDGPPERPCEGVKRVVLFSGGEREAENYAAIGWAAKLDAPEAMMLGLQSCRSSTFDDLAEQAETLKRFRSVHLMAAIDEPIADDDLAPLAKIENLVGLSLGGLNRTGLTDAGLVHLSGAKRLESLGLMKSQVTDAGLESLKNLESLEYLSLTGCPVEGPGLEHLQALPIKELSLSGTKVDDDGIEGVLKLSKLETLRLDGCPVREEGLAKLKSMNLTTLDLPAMRIDEETAAILAEFKGLKALGLSKCRITDRAARVLATIEGLEQITLHGAAISPASATDWRAKSPETKFHGANAGATLDVLKKAGATIIFRDELPGPDGRRRVAKVQFVSSVETDEKILAALPTLLELEEPEQITLFLHRFNPSHFDELAERAETLEKLKAVDLASNLEAPIRDADLVPLKRIRNLTGLSLQAMPRSELTDAGLAHVANLRNLKSLLLDNTAITDAGLAHLKALDSLEHFSAGLTDLTGEGLRHLNPGSMKILALVQTKFADAALEHVGKFENLETLYIGGCPVDGSGLEHLAGLKRLKQLSLAGTEVTDATLADLPDLPSIEWLTLSRCQIGDASVERLSQLSSLKQLGLSGTQVSDAGRRKLWEALPELDIQWAN